MRLTNASPPLGKPEPSPGILGHSDALISSGLSGVDFAGEITDASLPPGLAELVNDPDFREELNAEWIETLSKIQLRGKRPTTKREWLKLYLSLRDVLG